MATKKLILNFKSQPSSGNIFRFRVYVNGVSVVVEDGASLIRFAYGTGAPTDNVVTIGATLSDTINNTLSLLQSTSEITGSFGGYTVNIAYARVGNTIEATVTSSAPANLMTFWNLVSSSTILIQPESPCEDYFISTNTVGTIATSIFTLGAGSYYLRNNSLGINTPMTLPERFEAIVTRGFSYTVYTSGNTPMMSFSLPSSVDASAVSCYFMGDTLFVVATTALTLQYSIDGTTWQPENSFTGLSEGDYTVYVKDDYGCIKTFAVTNSGDTNVTNDVSPFTFISESNSLRMIKRVDRGNCSGYKSVFNTLSCEENTGIAEKYIQRFQSCDVIKTQVKTSYQNVSVGAGSTEITAEKIVANIGLQDKRDCYYYNYNGKLAVLFLTGNTYTYDTTDVTGTYALNGLLPEFGTVGTWVETPFGSLQVSNIRIADNGQRSLILNSNVNFTGNDTIQTIYNRDSFDIWEFTIDMSDFTDQKFTVGVEFSQDTPDVDWPNVYWISEKIWVKDRWENTTEIIWSNSKNTDIYFYSGITMKNRLWLCSVAENVSDGEVDVQKTDTGVEAIEAKDYHAVKFDALQLSTGMARKIKLALKHDNLIIDEVPYRLAENPSMEKKGDSNMYQVTAKLYEAGDVWNSGSDGTQDIGTYVEPVGLLEIDNNSYLRIL